MSNKEDQSTIKRVKFIKEFFEITGGIAMFYMPVQIIISIWNFSPLTLKVLGTDIVYMVSSFIITEASDRIIKRKSSQR